MGLKTNSWVELPNSLNVYVYGKHISFCFKNISKLIKLTILVSSKVILKFKENKFIEMELILCF